MVFDAATSSCGDTTRACRHPPMALARTPPPNRIAAIQASNANRVDRRPETLNGCIGERKQYLGDRILALAATDRHSALQMQCNESR